jgi:hypothetical protein
VISYFQDKNISNLITSELSWLKTVIVTDKQISFPSTATSRPALGPTQPSASGDRDCRAAGNCLSPWHSVNYRDNPLLFFFHRESTVLGKPRPPLLEVSKRYFLTLGRTTCTGFGTSHGLCLHRTTQHRKTMTNIHALSGIQTHDSSVQEVKTHVLDHATTVITTLFYII